MILPAISLSKAPVPSVGGTEDWTCTADRLAQLSNAPLPMLVTPFGIEIEVNPLPANADNPIVPETDEILIVDRFVQPANAESPMPIMGPSKITEDKFVQP